MDKTNAGKAVVQNGKYPDASPGAFAWGSADNGG